MKDLIEMKDIQIDIIMINMKNTIIIRKMIKMIRKKVKIERILDKKKMRFKKKLRNKEKEINKRKVRDMRNKRRMMIKG